MAKRLLLNIGSGAGRFKGYKNVDIDPTVHPDYIAPVEDLPFDKNSVDGIFASHILEHVKPGIDVVKEWKRVLKKGGFLIVTVPDIAQYLVLYAAGVITAEYLQATVYGMNVLDADSTEYMRHHRVYTPQLLWLELNKHFNGIMIGSGNLPEAGEAQMPREGLLGEVTARTWKGKKPE